MEGQLLPAACWALAAGPPHPDLVATEPLEEGNPECPPQAQRAAGQPVLTATEPPPQVPWLCPPSVWGCGGTEKQQV